MDQGRERLDTKNNIKETMVNKENSQLVLEVLLVIVRFVL